MMLILCKVSANRFGRVASLKAEHRAESVASHCGVTGDMFRAIWPDRMGSLADIPEIGKSLKLFTLTLGNLLLSI